MVWKLLVGDEPTLEDLAAADISMAHVVQSVRDFKRHGPASSGEARFQELFGDLRMVYPNSLGEEVAGEHWKVLEFAACIWVSIVACNV